MHEMPIAMEIVRQAVAAAEAHGAVSIEQIEVEIGKMRQIVPEALEMAFRACAEETIARQAKLVTTEIEMAARCRQCGHEFTPEITFFACPGCGAANAEIVSGNDIILKSLVAQTPEEANR